ncbi:response regulator, partial [bacterium]|nr:response regulator [bacterium]
DGQLWISFADGGIDKVIENKRNPKKAYFESALDSTEEFQPDINVMYEDSRGKIWLGTNGNGLYLFNKEEKRIVNFSTSTAIQGNIIYSIVEDNSQHLWLSTNSGLSSLNIINLSKPYVINYNAEDGLQGNIFIHKSCLKNKKGELFFGGYHGFNYFSPEKIKYNNYLPPMALTHFEVDREPRYINYRNGEQMLINHKNNSFQISFAALSYTKSINNQYQFMLEGYDQEWVSTKNGINNAIYGKLPAGEYRFLLRGSNNNGVWNNIPISLDVIVKKSPFKTDLAYAIYTLMSILIIWLSIYYTKQNFKLQQTIKDEQNERLRAEKINQFKLKFFTNISHELLTPLSIISNAIEQYLDKKPRESKHLSIVQRNADRLTRLINQLLDFRKVEGLSRKLMVEKCEFNHLISSLKDNFVPLCDKNNINFIVDGMLEKDIHIDIDKIDKMLHNILSNAFKHTPENGEIILSYNTYMDDSTEILKVAISNNGKGIPEDLIQQIFERFYRIDDRKHESGAGIGLAFTKSLVTLHKGTITAENKAKGGATFTINIPVSEWAYTDDEKYLEESNIAIEGQFAFEDEMDEIKVPISSIRESDEELPKILLVEDNHDMRTIMKNYLSKYFDIYESENGLEGLSSLNNVDIELIVSDIMMPEMDGLTFCKRVKSNITTSHIPVILTTAKRTKENLIEGYEAQADSYITKPVNLQLLLVRIINLLNQRNKLREIFSGDKQVSTKELSINNLDQQLFEKLNIFIDANISNSNLTIGMLSEHVNISSSVFYRKVKAFAGISPNEYLRSKRLNKAAELLRDGLSPSIVAYDCGFSDPSYFGVCFKKHFGTPPKKYAAFAKEMKNYPNITSRG